MQRNSFAARRPCMRSLTCLDICQVTHRRLQTLCTLANRKQTKFLVRPLCDLPEHRLAVTGPRVGCQTESGDAVQYAFCSMRALSNDCREAQARCGVLYCIVSSQSIFFCYILMGVNASACATHCRAWRAGKSF